MTCALLHSMVSEGPGDQIFIKLKGLLRYYGSKIIHSKLSLILGFQNRPRAMIAILLGKIVKELIRSASPHQIIKYIPFFYSGSGTNHILYLK